MNQVLLAAMLMVSSPVLAAAPTSDATATALRRCLDDPANAATAGQVECEMKATRSYDRSMNAAYATVVTALPPKAAQQLRRSQRAWLAFRDSEGAAIGAIFETRQGTMYVPMQAAATTSATRDRAVQLESYRRVIAIEP
jgi:uncharacterized protein YecT (DUF1311 family)